MRFFNYLFYRMYASYKENYDGDYARFWGSICIALIIIFQFGAILFLVVGLFRLNCSVDPKIISLVIIPVMCNYIPKKRCERILKRCQVWEQKHSWVEEIPAFVLCGTVAFFSLLLAAAAAMYMHGEILASWRF